MLIRITIVAFVVAGNLPSISSLIPVEFNDLNIACTGSPRFGDFLNATASFCQYLPTCLLNGGRKIGYCTARGICCLVMATCGKTISTISGYFASTDYPSPSVSTTGDCVVTIRPFDDRVCQVRLDFDDFSLAQPDSTGHCVRDSFEVIGSDFNYPVPVICGSNTGQHMYLNYAEGEIKLRLRATNTRWLIRITQIRCTAIANIAPAGCLQYFPGASGTVSGFNFIAGGAGHNLANQDYEVCLARTSATLLCNFTWTTASPRFSVTFGQLVPGDYPDSICIDDDYISILGGMISATPVFNPTSSNRGNLYCGEIPSFATSTFNIRTSQSERLRVFFNSDAVGTGFQFNFAAACG